MADFQIGTSQGSLANVETMGGNAPVGFFQPWVETADLGNGLARAMGRPMAQWWWGYIKPAQRAALKAFCPGKSARVYIRTLSDKCSGTYTTYQAAMLWPNDESQIGSPPFQIDFRDLTPV